MTKDESKPKIKKAKKLKRVGETESSEAVSASENYIAGEVASSLFSNKSSESVTPLFSLFDTKACAVKPVYVPVVTTKRKLPEADGTKEEKTVSGTSQDTLKKAKVKKEKEISIAEKNIVDRERALANADEEETVRKNLVKQKQKNRQMKNTVDDDGIMQPQKKSINKAEERIKNKRTIFVGNLPVDCTKKMLMTLFKDYGSIESVRFRSVARAEASLSRKVATIHRKVHPKRHNINAYVVFKEEASATKAVKSNSRALMESLGAGHVKLHDNKRSAFVGNLPYDIEEEAVRQHFIECGNIEAVRIVRDKHSGLGKGFCFVLFEDIDAVQLALKLNNTELMGRKLRVKRCGTPESTGKNTNKKFKEKLDTLKQAKPHQIKTFAGETVDSKINKNKNKIGKKKINKIKGHKNTNKQIDGKKKKVKA